MEPNGVEDGTVATTFFSSSSSPQHLCSLSLSIFFIIIIIFPIFWWKAWRTRYMCEPVFGVVVVFLSLSLVMLGRRSWGISARRINTYVYTDRQRGWYVDVIHNALPCDSRREEREAEKSDGSLGSLSLTLQGQLSSQDQPERRV